MTFRISLFCRSKMATRSSRSFFPVPVPVLGERYQYTSILMRQTNSTPSKSVSIYPPGVGSDQREPVSNREVMTTLIQQYRGRVVDSSGNNLLVECARVVEAVRGAVAIQHPGRLLRVQHGGYPPCPTFQPHPGPPPP